AVLLSDERARRALVANAVEMLERLTVDQAAEWTRVLRHARRQHAANLVQQSAIELLVDPARDALRDDRGRQSEADRDDVRIGDGRLRVREMLRQRAPCQEVHLQRADDALAIARLNADGRVMIYSLEDRMQV